MTYLIRWITSFEDKWLNSLFDVEDVTSLDPEDAPWALSLFLPSQKDKEGLSVYEVKDEVEARLVAAALMMRSSDDKRYVFVAAPTTTFQTAGIKILATPGLTGHSAVDGMHRDIQIKKTSQALSVTKIFLSGEIFTSEKKEIVPELEEQARLDQFDHRSIAETGGNPYFQRLGRLMKAKKINVRGEAFLSAFDA